MPFIDHVLIIYAAYTTLIFILYIFELIAILKNWRNLFKTSFYRIFSVMAVVNIAACLLGTFTFRLGLYPLFFALYGVMSADNGWITAAHSGSYYLNCLSEFLGVLLAFNRFTALYLPLRHYQFWSKFLYLSIPLCLGIALAPCWFLFDDPTRFLALGDSNSSYYVVVANSTTPEPSIWFNMVIVTLASNGVASILYTACIAGLCLKSNRHNTIAERNLFLVGFCSMLFSLPYMTAMIIFYRNLSTEISVLGGTFDIDLMRFITYQIPWLSDLKYLSPAPMLFVTNNSIRRTIRKMFTQ